MAEKAAELETLVDLIGQSRARILQIAPGVVSEMDQAAAEACESLEVAFGIDLSDPVAAHVAAAVATYIINKGREACGCMQPETGLQVFHKLRGMDLAATGVGAAVFSKHGART